MSILRIIFQIIGQLDGDLSVPEISSAIDLIQQISSSDLTTTNLINIRSLASKFLSSTAGKLPRQKPTKDNYNKLKAQALMRAAKRADKKKVKEILDAYYKEIHQTEIENRRAGNRLQNSQLRERRNEIRSTFEAYFKEQERIKREQVKEELKRLEELKAHELEKIILQDRLVLNMMKATFKVLEENLYERLAIYTPVDTGNLLSSLYAKHIGLLAVQIGFNTKQAPYAIYVHEAIENRHPNGGISQFLLTAFLEAWTQTLAASVTILTEQADLDNKNKTLFLETLGSMHYGIDISKDKLAVTISLSANAAVTNLDSTLYDIANAIKDDPETAKSKTESLLAEEREILFNYLNDTSVSFEQLTTMSKAGRLTLNRATLNRDFSQDNKQSATWRKRQERLKTVALKLHKIDIEDEQTIYKLKTSKQARALNTKLLDENISNALTTRIAADTIFKTKRYIKYPLILDKMQRAYNKLDREAVEEDDEEEFDPSEFINETDDDEEFDASEFMNEAEDDEEATDLIEGLSNELKALEPDEPALGD